MSGDVLAVIPVRGGSTRIKQKNLQEVGDKPLVAHAIADAAAADEIERTIVSTDDPKIRSVVQEYGGDAPFKRPANLATDEAPTSPVITHALDWLNNRGETFEIVCLVQATVPFRRPADIDGAVRRLRDSGGAQSVITVTEYADPPQWAITETAAGYLTEHYETGVLWGDVKRSQELDELTYPNGAVYAAYTDTWREQESFYTERTVGYHMPPKRSLDIDEPWELELARALRQYRQES